VTSISHQLRLFRNDRRGAFSVYAALVLPVALAAAGFGLDYASALSTKARLDSAADSASVAAVRAATTYMRTNPRKLSGDALIAAAKTEGQTAARQSFNANASASIDFNPKIDIQLPEYDPATHTFTAKVSYTFDSKLHFGQLVGQPTMTLAGEASAEQRSVQYIKIYALVDTSQSMGIAANTAEMSRLYAATKCVFACHTDDADRGKTYAAARSQNIKLRIDVARKAIYNMADAAQSLATSANIQFEVYGMTRMSAGPAIAKPLGTTSYSTWPQEKAVSYWSKLWPANGGDTADYANLKNAMAEDARTLDISLWPVSTYTGAVTPPPLYTATMPWASGTITNMIIHPPGDYPRTYAGATDIVGDTDLATSISQIASQLPRGGDGSSPSSPLTFAFVVSDGLENVPYQSRSDCTVDPAKASLVSWCVSAINPSACQPLKDRNMIVGGLYTTYLPLYYANDPSKGYDSNYYFNPTATKGRYPYFQVGAIPDSFKQCATDGWFFEAQDDVALLAGMNALFQKALGSANRLTQ
jgi:Flp pilus assembly protein TadG